MAQFSLCEVHTNFAVVLIDSHASSVSISTASSSVSWPSSLPSVLSRPFGARPAPAQGPCTPRPTPGPTARPLRFEQFSVFCQRKRRHPRCRNHQVAHGHVSNRTRNGKYPVHTPRTARLDQNLPAATMRSPLSFKYGRCSLHNLPTPPPLRNRTAACRVLSDESTASRARHAQLQVHC